MLQPYAHACGELIHERGAHHKKELANFDLAALWRSVHAQPPALDDSEHHDGMTAAGVCIQLCERHLPESAPSVSIVRSLAWHSVLSSLDGPVPVT